MKKLLSVILTITLLVSVISVSALSTNAQSVDFAQLSKDVANAELSHSIEDKVASLKARTYKVSEEAQVPYTQIDGYAYGYVGDVDGDNTITIMDATAIQLHIAQIEPLMATLQLLADVTADNHVTILDATEIQLFVAQLSDSQIIFHMLYSPFDDFDPMLDTFDDIAKLLETKGTYDKQENHYYLDSTIELDNSEVYTRLAYTPVTMSEPEILLYTITYFPEYNSYCELVTIFTRGYEMFNLYATEYTDDFILYQKWGRASVSDITEDGLVLEYDKTVGSFESDYGVTHDEVKAVLPAMCLMNLSSAESLVMYDIPGSFLDLVYDITKLYEFV